MPRELDKGLFGAEQPSPSVKSDAAAAGVDQDRDQMLKDLSHQLKQMKRQVKEMESRIESTNNRVNELAQSFKARAERMQSGYQRLEQFLKSSLQDFNERFSKLSGKVTEKRVADTKVQEMIDRHNTIVHSFEQRLNQLQKLMSEQEMKLMHYQSALEETKRELRR